MKTIFCDVDGVILKQPEKFLDLYKKVIINPFGDVIPESRDKLFEWYTKDYTVILTTGRPEQEREVMTNYLMNNGVYFHQLIMNCGSGIRYLVNDVNPHQPETMKAVAVNVERNKSLSGVDI